MDKLALMINQVHTRPWRMIPGFNPEHKAKSHRDTLSEVRSYVRARDWIVETEVRRRLQEIER